MRFARNLGYLTKCVIFGVKFSCLLGSVGIILRVSFKETVLGVERLPRIGV